MFPVDASEPHQGTLICRLKTGVNGWLGRVDGINAVGLSGRKLISHRHRLGRRRLSLRAKALDFVDFGGRPFDSLCFSLICFSWSQIMFHHVSALDDGPNSILLLQYQCCFFGRSNVVLGRVVCSWTFEMHLRVGTATTRKFHWRLSLILSEPKSTKGVCRNSPHHTARIVRTFGSEERSKPLWGGMWDEHPNRNRIWSYLKMRMHHLFLVYLFSGTLVSGQYMTIQRKCHSRNQSTVRRPSCF